MWFSLLWRRAGLPTLAKVLPHGLGVSLEVPFGVAPETHDFRGFPSAPERTRTSTDHTVHKALNLARLPIPPQALRAASIASVWRWPGAIVASDERIWGFYARRAPARVESVLGARYILEHMFEPPGDPGPTEQGADGWT